MDLVLHALAEPRRRRILSLVRDRELSAGDIAAQFGDVTRPAVSQHLTVLQAAGLLQVRRAGARRLYRARPQGLADLREWLDGIWPESRPRSRSVRSSQAGSVSPPGPLPPHGQG